MVTAFSFYSLPLVGEGWGGGNGEKASRRFYSVTPTPNLSPPSGRSRPSSTGYGGGEPPESGV